MVYFPVKHSCLHSCFEKCCPTKPYGTMWKGIVGNGGSWSLDCVIRCFSDIERNSTNKFRYAFSFLVAKHREPQSSNAKLFLPIIPIDIVACAFTLLWDNLCRNSCIIKVSIMWVFLTAVSPFSTIDSS